MKFAWVVSILLVSAFLIGAASAASPAKVAGSTALKMSPEFASSISSKPQDEMVRVIIKYRPGEAKKGPFSMFSAKSEANISEKVRLYGGNVRYEYSIMPGIAASVPAGMIETLASDSAVEAVYPVKTYYITRLQATPLMKADSAAANYGVNGTGINISILDTGVYNHTEFQNPSRIIKQKCYCTSCCVGNANEADTADDDNGHGTHVAGIAAGQGSATYGYGVATNASIFAVKVCNSAGSCLEDDIIKGLEWSAQNGANIISMSLGGPVNSSCYESDLPSWVDNLTAQGLLFVIAAGNCGIGSGEPTNVCPTKGNNTIASPACAKSALTVGAAAKTDAIASYSSRGATLDNRTKPDVLVIGSSITSTRISGVSISGCTNINPDYAICSGTSMATPFVSGEAALIMEKYRHYYGFMPDPSLVKAIIMTAVNTTGMSADAGHYTQRNNVYGSGRIDVNESLRIIRFSLNGSIGNGQMINKTTRINNGTFIATLYWPENSSTRNNLDLIVGNSTVNFSQATDANDTVEQVMLFNLSEGLWNMYVNGTNVSGSQRYFLAWSNSVTPYWYGNKTITTSVYSPSNLSYFNISWESSEALSSVWVEGNWSGSAANYSMTAYGMDYSYNATLPAGDFYWRGWANDTAGNTNSTDAWIFSVARANASVVLLLNGSSGNRTYELGDDINMTAFSNCSGYVYLDMNASWLGSNFTNATGYVSNTSSTLWFGISYLEANASFYGNQNCTTNKTTLYITINDTRAPSLAAASIFPYSILPGDNITVYANASDYSLDRVWFNISNSSGFGAMVFMQNVSARFNASYNTSALSVGTYNIIVFANDTRNNVSNTSAGMLNITVPRNMTIAFLGSDSSSTNVSIILFYNGTSTARHQTSNTTIFSSMLPEGLWDVRVSSTFNVTMFNLNVTSNVTGNLTLDTVPNANVTLSGFVPIQIVALESGLNFSNATIIIPNSSIATNLNTTVLACHSWNISNRSCSGAWENATANSSISSGLVSVNTTNFSAFAVMRNTTCGDGFIDLGENSATCCEDAGCPSGQSCSSSTHACYTPSVSSGGDGGSASFSAPPKKRVLGMIAPESVTLKKNSSKDFSVSLLNSGEVKLSNISFSYATNCSGCLLDFYNGSFSLDINESRTFLMTLHGVRSGVFNVIIKASGAEASNSSPITVKVLECEPGKRECKDKELLTCSEDGMMLNRTSCDYLCEDGKCKKYVNITMNKNESQVSPVLESSIQHLPWLEAAAVVAVLVVLMVFVLLKL